MLLSLNFLVYILRIPLKLPLLKECSGWAGSTILYACHVWNNRAKSAGLSILVLKNGYALSNGWMGLQVRCKLDAP